MIYTAKLIKVVTLHKDVQGEADKEYDFALQFRDPRSEVWGSGWQEPEPLLELPESKVVGLIIDEDGHLSPDHYYVSSDFTDLQDVIDNIGSALESLRSGRSVAAAGILQSTLEELLNQERDPLFRAADGTARDSEDLFRTYVEKMRDTFDKQKLRVVDTDDGEVE